MRTQRGENYFLIKLWNFMVKAAFRRTKASVKLREGGKKIFSAEARRSALIWRGTRCMCSPRTFLSSSAASNVPCEKSEQIRFSCARRRENFLLLPLCVCACLITGRLFSHFLTNVRRRDGKVNTRGAGSAALASLPQFVCCCNTVCWQMM